MTRRANTLPAAGAEANRFSMCVLVETPAGPSNRYAVDSRSGAVMLSAVDANAAVAPVEWGTVVGSRGETGAPLRAAVVVRLPTFRGCLVTAYPLALAWPGNDEAPTVVAVPAADAALANVRTIAELPAPLRDGLLTALRGTAIEDAAAAGAAVRAAREAARRAETSSRSRAPLWRTGGPVVASATSGEAQPHTIAELAIPLLPQRFQEYVARALLPEERILLFLERPPAVQGRMFGLRRTKLRHGILIITDHQLLFMTDSSDVDSTFVHWGYSARSGAVERVADAGVRIEADRAVLDVLFAARRGAEKVSLDFPGEYAADLEVAAELLRGFVPAPNTHAVRRLYAREAPSSLPELAEVLRHEPPPRVCEIARDRRLLAWAEAPAERGPGPLLAVGERTALVVDGRRGGMEEVPIADLTSLELTLSLLGSRLELATGDGEAVRRTVLRFDYPAAAPFLGAFAAIRQLMGLPPEDGSNGGNSP